MNWDGPSLDFWNEIFISPLSQGKKVIGPSFKDIGPSFIAWIEMELYGCHWCHSHVEKTAHRNWKCICHWIYQEKEGVVLNLVALKINCWNSNWAYFFPAHHPLKEFPIPTCSLEWDHHFYKVRLNIYANRESRLKNKVVSAKINIMREYIWIVRH